MKDDGYKIRDEFSVYYLTFAVVQWVDVFTRKAYVDIVLNSLKFCIDNKQLKLFAWYIMTNHVHLLAQSSKGDQRCSKCSAGHFEQRIKISLWPSALVGVLRAGISIAFTNKRYFLPLLVFCVQVMSIAFTNKRY
jgi:hypothetical protein